MLQSTSLVELRLRFLQLFDHQKRQSSIVGLRYSSKKLLEIRKDFGFCLDRITSITQDGDECITPIVSTTSRNMPYNSIVIYLCTFVNSHAKMLSEEICFQKYLQSSSIVF